MAGSQTTNVDREVVQAARALYLVGSIDEAISLLRGAVCRDPSQVFCEELLGKLQTGQETNITETSVHLDLELVDKWIRRGMLVEALALLGGTALGSEEKGREWADLLGELMAPVPVDAEDALVEMHGQLMSGGASVALTLLEERERSQPALPAWANRRLAVLRWMLLDNASAAETREVAVPASELAGVLSISLSRRGLPAALEAVRAFVRGHPDHADGARALIALEALNDDITRQVHLTQASNNTMPMVGHMAAVMQVRMGNLENARRVYSKLIEDDDDERAQVLLAEVEVLLAALAGESISDVEELAGEATQMRATNTVEPAFPMTKETRLPEESGRIVVTELEAPDGVDYGPTTEIPTADVHAEQLVRQGRLAEAEEIYRGLASLQPERRDFQSRADELRSERHGHARAANSGVLVRVILPVK